jgi:hypothetical protein
LQLIRQGPKLGRFKNRNHRAIEFVKDLGSENLHGVILMECQDQSMASGEPCALKMFRYHQGADLQLLERVLYIQVPYRERIPAPETILDNGYIAFPSLSGYLCWQRTTRNGSGYIVY